MSPEDALLNIYIFTAHAYDTLSFRVTRCYASYASLSLRFHVTLDPPNAAISRNMLLPARTMPYLPRFFHTFSSPPFPIYPSSSFFCLLPSALPHYFFFDTKKSERYYTPYFLSYFSAAIIDKSFLLARRRARRQRFHICQGITIGLGA